MTKLYDDLGLAPDATDAEIKAAHRAAAKKHHPDAGGDRDAFERASHAAMVLRDPARRAKYDATGDDGSEPDNKASMIASMMNAALNAALEQARGDFEHTDLVGLMQEHTAEQLGAIRGEIAKGKDALKRIDKMLERVRFKGEGQNLLANILRDRKQNLQQQLRQLNDSRDGYEQLTEALDLYGWEVDAAQQVDIEELLRRSRYGGPNYMSATTTC